MVLTHALDNKLEGVRDTPLPMDIVPFVSPVQSRNVALHMYEAGAPVSPDMSQVPEGIAVRLEQP